MVGWRAEPARASGRLAEHIAQGTGCGQGNTDLYGLVRTCTDLYGRWAQGYVGAVRSGNSIAHGCVPCQPSASLLRHVHGVHQRTKHIPTGWQSTLRNADTGGRGIRTCTDLYGLVRTIGTGLCGGPVPRKFHSTWLRALPAKCHVRISPYSSVFVRIPLPAVSALRNVLCQSSGGSRARQGDSRQSPRPMFGWPGTFAAEFIKLPAGNGLLPVPTEPCCILRPACKLLHGKGDR